MSNPESNFDLHYSISVVGEGLEVEGAILDQFSLLRALTPNTQCLVT